MLNRSHHELLREKGWAILPSVDLQNFVKENMGAAISDPVSRELIDVIRTKHGEKRSGYLSRGLPSNTLPLHTDYPNSPVPPHYIALSVSGDVADADTIVFRLREFVQSPEGRDFFHRQALVPCVLRMLDGRRTLCRICQVENGALIARYAWNCMSTLFASDNELFNKVPQLAIDHALFAERLPLREGELCIIDNHSCLHGRSPSLERNDRSNQINADRVVLRALFDKSLAN